MRWRSAASGKTLRGMDVDQLGAKMHTAARRFCIDRIGQLQTEYRRLIEAGQAYTHDSLGRNVPTLAGLDLFPRYRILAAILLEVERMEPGTLTALDLAQNRLATACRSAQALFTETDLGPVAGNAMEQEREAFFKYVEGLTGIDLQEVPQLFYRRVLTDAEVEQWRTALGDTWGASREKYYWYPLSKETRNDLVALDSDRFAQEVPLQDFNKILAESGPSRSVELREWGPSYEVDISALDFSYEGAEGFWFTAQLDWIIYASHEDSITIGGEVALEALKQVWPKWHEAVWTRPW